MTDFTHEELKAWMALPDIIEELGKERGNDIANDPGERSEDSCNELDERTNTSNDDWTPEQLRAWMALPDISEELREEFETNDLKHKLAQYSKPAIQKLVSTFV